MLAVTGQVGVLLITAALIILGAVRLPVAETHPAEVVATRAALHVVAAAVLLYADLTFRAVLR